jgi:ion channel-forming bestrophin family protein
VCPDTALTVVNLPLFFQSTVFRTNTSYKRWEEANFYWCKAKVQSRNIVRLASAAMNRSNISKQRQVDDLKQLNLCVWAYLRTMKRQLSSKEEDEIAFLNDVHEKLPKEHAVALLAAQHRPLRALQDLSYAIENLNMSTFRKDELHEAVSSFEVVLGTMEQILASPVPLFYTRHTVRFLFTWLSLLPTALYSGIANAASPLWNSLLLVPMMYILSMFLFGIDEIAMQCEEPFSILPQQKYCDSTYKDCLEIASFEYEEEWNGANGSVLHVMNGAKTPLLPPEHRPAPPVPLLGNGAFALKSSAAQRLFGNVNGASKTVAQVPQSSSRTEFYQSSASYQP